MSGPAWKRDSRKSSEYSMGVPPFCLYCYNIRKSIPYFARGDKGRAKRNPYKPGKMVRITIFLTDTA